MNRHDVHLLQQVQGTLCVTITLPTHRTSPDNKQDPIRLRNLVTDATKRLLQDFGKRDIATLQTRLEALAASINHETNLDGLALFVSNDFAQAYKLPFRLQEKIVVGDNFYTRDLVFALNRTPRYWVLALSEQPTRLYEGVRETLIEVTAGPFPMQHGGPGGESRLPGGPGVNISAYRDEYHRQFFRRVDSAFGEFMKEDPLPLGVVGVDRLVAFFNEVTAHRNAIVGTVFGSHDRTPAHELGKLVWPVVKEGLAAQRQQVLKDLETAVSAQRFASGIGEVWRFAHEGRGSLLLVEEGYKQPATVDESGRHLTLADNPTDLNVLDDAVDEVIEKVLELGGRVVFTDPGTLTKHQRIALTLRF